MIRQFVITFGLVFGLSLSSCSEHADPESTSVDVSAASIIGNDQAYIAEPEWPWDNFSCPYGETRRVFLSHTETPDMLNVNIVGDNCDTAIMELTVKQAEDDKVIYSYAKRALDHASDAEGPSGVYFVIESLTSFVPEASKMPDLLTEEDGFYDVDRQSWATVRQTNQPIFCHKAGKSFSDCFAYLDGETRRLFSSGS